jgi:hypothetical protein
MHHRTAALLATLAVGGVGSTAWAQTANIAQVYVVTPEDHMDMQFEAALAQHAQWRRDTNDPWSWMVYQVVTGEDVGDFLIRSSGHTWADFDAYDAGFGPQGFANWMEHVGPLVESVDAVITAADTTNYDWPEDPSSVTLIHLITFELVPGKEPAFFEAVGKFHQAIQQSDYPMHYGFGSLLAGGEGPSVTLALPFANWAAMQGPDKQMATMLAEVYGPAGAQELFEQFNATFSSTESIIIRARPDLSVMSGM